MSIDRKISLTKRLRYAANLITTGSVYGRKRDAIISEHKKSPFIWPFGLSDTPQWSWVDYNAYYEEGFSTNSVIYAAVMTKVRAIAQLDLVAATGDLDEPTKVPIKQQHPLSILLARPNPYMSETQYQALQEMYLNLTGNAFGVLIRPNRTALPTEIWPLNPTWVQIIPDSKGGIKGYLYNPNGVLSDGSIPFLPSDMMHVKLPNPLDPLYGLGFGLSPLSPLAQSGDVDNQITKFLKSFFQKGAMPSGALKLKDMTLDDDSIAEIKQRWMEVYGGVDNWTDIAVLDMTMEYERIGLTFQEMDFEKIDNRNESRMLLPFGVPAELMPIKLGLEGSTFANKDEARRYFWEDTMQYEMSLFIDVYQQYLSTDDGYFPIWDTSKVSALKKDIAALIDGATKLWAIGVPAKTAFVTVGLEIEDYPGNDIGFLPFSVMPVAPNGKPELPEPTATEDNPDDNTPSGNSDENDSTDDSLSNEQSDEESKTLKKNWSNDQKLIIYKQFDMTATKHEKPFGKAAIECFERDRRKILSIVGENKRKSLELKATVNFPDIENDITTYLFGEARENWRSVFTPVMLAELEDTGKFWSNQLGIQFDIRNIEGESWFTDYVTVFANPITETSNEVIHDVISQAMSEGWSNDTLANVFDDTFDVWITGDIDKTDFEWLTNPAARPGLGNRMLHWRKEMIARTETTRIANAGAFNLFDRWGVKKKEWLSTGDDRTRDWHLSMSGQIVDIRGKFKSGLGNLLEYPGDASAPLNETIQCRCTILPVIE